MGGRGNFQPWRHRPRLKFSLPRRSPTSAGDGRFMNKQPALHFSFSHLPKKFRVFHSKVFRLSRDSICGDYFRHIYRAELFVSPSIVKLLARQIIAPDFARRLKILLMTSFARRFRFEMSRAWVGETRNNLTIVEHSTAWTSMKRRALAQWEDWSCKREYNGFFAWAFIELLKGLVGELNIWFRRLANFRKLAWTPNSRSLPSLMLSK